MAKPVTKTDSNSKKSSEVKKKTEVKEKAKTKDDSSELKESKKTVIILSKATSNLIEDSLNNLLPNIRQDMETKKSSTINIFRLLSHLKELSANESDAVKEIFSRKIKEMKLGSLKNIVQKGYLDFDCLTTKHRMELRRMIRSF